MTWIVPLLLLSAAVGCFGDPSIDTGVRIGPVTPDVADQFIEAANVDTKIQCARV